MWRLLRAAAVVLLAVIPLAVAAPAAAHDERDVRLPDGSGYVPEYRTSGPQLLVCKEGRTEFTLRIADFAPDLRARNLALYDACIRSGFRHLQEAVDAVQQPGTNILVLPGTYYEEPSLAAPAPACENLPAPQVAAGYQVLTFEQQQACPHNQNLVAVLGKRDLQIEGTGQQPGDVVLDAQYRKLNAIRADRANGIYLRNFTAQRTSFNAVYILETDGFVIDRMVGRWNDEYGFLTFATDHGLYTDCEGYGNGDSGIYPGSASNLNSDRGHQVRRYAVEIRNCSSHDNLLGYSGTAGDSVWAHHNKFYDNSAGASMDSAFPDHPGLPQNHAKFENNDIHDNNRDYNRYVRDGTCAKPYAERGYEDGVVCPATGVPVGTGILTAGGNYNVFRDNWVYGHDRTGFMLFWVPAFIRGESAWSLQTDTSHANQYTSNQLGVSPTGERRRNATDFWWDGQGEGNCWQDPVAGATPRTVPGCDRSFAPSRAISEPGKLAKLLTCSNFSRDERRVPATCDWYGARGLERIEVRLALGVGVLLAGAAALLWLRRRRWLPDDSPRTVTIAHACAAAGLLGAVVGVVGAAYEASLWPAVSSFLLAAWWIGTGLLLRTDRPGLGLTTVILGAFALLDAVDSAVVMLPVLPVPPAWLTLLLGIAWLVWLPIVMLRAGHPVDKGRPRHAATVG